MLLIVGAHAHASLRGGLPELKRDLSHAQTELTHAQSRVLRLEEAIAEKEVQRIREQLEKIEEGQLAALLHSQEEVLAYFYDQRETLSTIIRSHPTCSHHAQEVMDQILTLITHLSDSVE